MSASAAPSPGYRDQTACPFASCTTRAARSSASETVRSRKSSASVPGSGMGQGRVSTLTRTDVDVSATLVTRVQLQGATATLTKMVRWLTTAYDCMSGKRTVEFWAQRGTHTTTSATKSQSFRGTRIDRLGFVNPACDVPVKDSTPSGRGSPEGVKAQSLGRTWIVSWKDDQARIAPNELSDHCRRPMELRLIPNARNPTRLEQL